MEIIYKLDQLTEVADRLLFIGKDFTVWAFNAPMGAGKTTLISQICFNLGIKDAISSPTYSIINEYQLPNGNKYCHMDWYRLRDEEEALRAGVEDALYNHTLSFVEWPEKAAQLLPNSTLYIQIELVDQYTRKITINDDVLTSS